jgi:hypothetical protein
MTVNIDIIDDDRRELTLNFSGRASSDLIKQLKFDLQETK